MDIEIRPVYPYGVNDCLGEECRKEDTHVLVGNKFPHIPKKRDRVFRGTTHKNSDSFSPNEFLIPISVIIY